MNNKKYNIIVFGATSFVGKIVVQYLLENYGVDKNVSWAIAARSKTKLEKLKVELGPPAERLQVLVADVEDEQSLFELVGQTTLVVTTVGPYALYGEPLLKECVTRGTHYCDLTGETQWIHAMLNKYEGKAQETGARVVHCCGFDSIPSDLGVWYLQREYAIQTGKACMQVEMFVRVLKGWISGGTAASLVNVIKALRDNPELKQVLVNPYSLCPKNHSFTAVQSSAPVGFSQSVDSWWAPFIMSAINTRVVHRTNALLDNRYGEDFKYSESTLTGGELTGRLKAHVLNISLSMLMIGLYFFPTRWLLQKFALPRPGNGPSAKERERGYYDLRFVASCDGEQLIVKVTGDKDPGYGSTAKMLAESALCNAMDIKTTAGGFFTPASLMAEPLLKRLVNNAGMTFGIVDRVNI